MSVYTFPCGCQFKTLGPPAHPGEIPLLDVDFGVDEGNIPDCPEAYTILANGYTKGIFQLESNLGRQWSKKLKPENIEHLGALAAILRPGSLRAVDKDGISMTSRYVLRKNGLENVGSYHPIIDELLKATYGSILYQENCLAIAVAVAGFTPAEADKLRKSIGKKLAAEMAKCKAMFVEGARKAGVLTEEQIHEVFGWIEKSQKYSFNRCLSGSEILRRPNNGRHSIEHMYRTRNDIEYAKRCGQLSLHKKWKLVGNYGKGLSMCEDGRIRPNTIVDIQPAGRRMVYRVQLESGESIEVTGNHKFPTSNGVMTVEQIQGCMEPVNLYLCGGRTKRGEKGYPTKSAPIESIECVGEADTYDVTMAAPNHNFVTGQGIITCNSHAISYGIQGYDCAWAKAHFPAYFYASFMEHAENRGKEKSKYDIRREFIEEAKLFGLSVEPPDFRDMQERFQVRGKQIYFGVAHVKGLGEASLTKMKKGVSAVGKPRNEWNWRDFLMYFSDHISSTVARAIIKVGALRFLNLPRQRMLAEYEAWNGLTDLEKTWVRDSGLPLLDALKEGAKTKKNGGACHAETRVAVLTSLRTLLENPPTPLVDSPVWLSAVEEQLLGSAVTCAKIESCDTSMTNATCKDFADRSMAGPYILAGELTEVRELKTRGGKTPGAKMGRLILRDSTCSVDCVVFPDVWHEVSHIMLQNNLVILRGERDRKEENGNLIVKGAWQAVLAANS